MTTHVGYEPWRAKNPIAYEECANGLVQRGSEDNPLRLYVPGDEEEIVAACVNERRCWNCHENWPAPPSAVNLPLWSSWGNHTEPDFDVRRARIAQGCCPICAAPSAPSMILSEIQDSPR